MEFQGIKVCFFPGKGVTWAGCTRYYADMPTIVVCVGGRLRPEGLFLDFDLECQGCIAKDLLMNYVFWERHTLNLPRDYLGFARGEEHLLILAHKDLGKIGRVPRLLGKPPRP